MKILLFSGSHSRHLFVHKAITSLDIDYQAIVMKRESLIPEVPNKLAEKDIHNFKKHFQDRQRIENEAYSKQEIKDVFDEDKTLLLSPSELNSKTVINKVKEFNPDITFIFGCDLIREPLLSTLPKYKINLHLGLSPWYRGSATLFWPFYQLEPQFAGITLHNITNIADAGDIFHQSVPELSVGDGIHDVSVKAVKKAKYELVEMINIFNLKRELYLNNQKTSGRVWRDKDFNPYHLRLIYDLYNNQIVDEYLKGNLGSHKPKLIQGLQV